MAAIAFLCELIGASVLVLYFVGVVDPPIYVLAPAIAEMALLVVRLVPILCRGLSRCGDKKTKLMRT